MKKDTLQKKRRPVQKKKGLTLLYSKTRRKKQRVSATADLGSEVPNLGVARALFIILLLHLAAIAAIIVHNRMTNDDPVVLKSEPPAKTSAVVAAARAVAPPLPQVQQGEDYYFVATGDSYERVAELKSVSVQSLRALNDNVPMQAGRILRIPTPGVSTMAAAPVDFDTSNPRHPEGKKRMAAVEAIAVSTRNPIEISDSEPAPVVRTEELPPSRAVIVDTADPVVQAVRVRPLIGPPVTEAQSGKKYTVKSGDTVWSISRRFSVSRENLLRVNGVSDPRKLRIGMTLVIPEN